MYKPTYNGYINQQMREWVSMGRPDIVTAPAILSLTKRDFEVLPRQLEDQAKALKQPTRAKVMATIEASPGLGVRELCRRLNLGNGVLLHHLGVLEQVGLVTRRREGLKHTCYPAAHVPPRPVVELVPLQQAILEELLYRPGLSQRELARRLGLNHRTLHRHIHKLHEKGLLTIEPRGSATALFVTGELADGLSY